MGVEADRLIVIGDSAVVLSLPDIGDAAIADGEAELRSLITTSPAASTFALTRWRGWGTPTLHES
jgi:hypothetical protein